MDMHIIKKTKAMITGLLASTVTLLYAVDFNADGHSDLLVQQEDGSYFVQLIKEGEKAGRIEVIQDRGWTVGNIEDYDGNGYSDILFKESDGSLRIQFFDQYGKAKNTFFMQDKGWSIEGIGKKYEPTNVMFYGARGDDALDDTEAFKKAVDSGIKSIFIPAGTYILSEKIDLKDKLHSVVGEGMGVSRLEWKAGSASSGIIFKPTMETTPITIKKITFLTAMANQGTAVEVDGSGYVVNGIIQKRTHPHLMVSDIEIRGNGAGNVTGWETGLKASSVLQSVVRGFHFAGYNAKNISLSQSGLSFGGDGQPVELIISESSIYSTDVAIDVDDYEGLFVSNSNLVKVNYGIRFLSDATTQLNVSNVHINCLMGGIWTDNVNHISIADSLFFAHPKASQSVFGVLLEGKHNVYKIKGNSFINNSSQYYNPVTVNGGYGHISSNIFSLKNNGDAVILTPTASHAKVKDNIFINTTNSVIDNGNNNTVELN